MKNMIRYACAMLFASVSCSAAAADAESIRHELEIFLSSGIGSIVSIVLLLLFLMWLVLPLAVFGLKTRIRRLTREVSESNRMLADILATNKALAENRDASDVAAHIEETNRILADIRDELSVLKEEDEPGARVVEQSPVDMPEDSAADYYDKIKYEP